jgi:hypothetical protein
VSKRDPDHAAHRELRGCCCRGLEQHHQNTALEVRPNSSRRRREAIWASRVKAASDR